MLIYAKLKHTVLTFPFFYFYSELFTGPSFLLHGEKKWHLSKR